jgi:hypothetical protein
MVTRGEPYAQLTARTARDQADLQAGSHEFESPSTTAAPALMLRSSKAVDELTA